MLDTSVLSTLAMQLMSGEQVEVEGQRLGVRRTSSGRFRTVSFVVAGHEISAIEQNPINCSAGLDPSMLPSRAALGSNVQLFMSLSIALMGRIPGSGVRTRARSSRIRQMLVPRSR
jgi:hypothetical protein